MREITEILEEIQERGDIASTYNDWYRVGRDERLLVNALTAILELHQPKTETIYRACPEHVIAKTMSDPGRFTKMRNCPDCVSMPHQICDHCDCPNDEWPCPTYRIILRELT